jgi:hypothetical protein
MPTRPEGPQESLVENTPPLSHEAHHKFTRIAWTVSIFTDRSPTLGRAELRNESAGSTRDAMPSRRMLLPLPSWIVCGPSPPTTRERKEKRSQPGSADVSVLS